MALSKRNLIKQSKSFFRRRSIKLTMTIVDLSNVMSIPRGKHSDTPGPIDLHYHIHPVEPRESGIGKLFGWS